MRNKHHSIKLLVLAALFLSVQCNKKGSSVKDLGTNPRTCDQLTYMFESLQDEYYAAVKAYEKNSCAVMGTVKLPRRGLTLRSATDANNAETEIPALSSATASATLGWTTPVSPVTGVSNGVNNGFNGSLAGGSTASPALLLDDPTTTPKPEAGKSVVVTETCEKMKAYVLDLNKYIRGALNEYNSLPAGGNCRLVTYGANKTRILDYPGCTTPCQVSEPDCWKCASTKPGPDGDHDGSVLCSTRQDAAFQVNRWCKRYGVKCGVNLDEASGAISLNNISCDPRPPLEVLGETIAGSSTEVTQTNNTSRSWNPLDVTLKMGGKFDWIPGVDVGAEASNKTAMNVTINAVTGVSFLSSGGFPFVYDDSRQKVETLQEVQDPNKQCANPVNVASQSWKGLPVSKSVCMVVANAGSGFTCVGQDIMINAINNETRGSVTLKALVAGFEAATAINLGAVRNTTRTEKMGIFRASGRPVTEITAQCRDWVREYVKGKMNAVALVNGSGKPLPLGEIKISVPKVKCTFKNGKIHEVQDFFLIVKEEAIQGQYRRQVDALSGTLEQPLIFGFGHSEVPGNFVANIEKKEFSPAEVAAFMNEVFKPKSEVHGEWAINQCAPF
ncbi:MAG: hypothetical protein AB7T49_18860 [Oligoflexales bacterium]